MRSHLHAYNYNSNSKTFPSSPCISTMMISEAVQAAKFNQLNPVWSDKGTLACTMAIHRHSMHESFLGLKGPSEDSGRTPKAARQLNRATREVLRLKPFLGGFLVVISLSSVFFYSIGVELLRAESSVHVLRHLRHE